MYQNTLQNNPMEIVVDNMRAELAEQGEISSLGWITRVNMIVGRLARRMTEPRENRFMDPRLERAHEQAMSQINTIHNLTR